MKKNVQRRLSLIENILKCNVKCICGFTYTEEYLNALTTQKLISISKNPELKIYEHDKDCLKKYKHSLTVKHCIKCGKEISKRKKSGICDECEKKERLTRVCKNCGRTVILSSAREHFEYCESCILLDVGFKNNIKNLMNIEMNIRNIIFNHSYDMLSDLFFNKFFNKVSIDKQKFTFDKEFDSFKFRKLKESKTVELYSFINSFINHLIKNYSLNHWTFDTITNLMTCLMNVNNNTPGYVITENKLFYSYKTELYGWNNLLEETFDSVINALLEFKFKGCDGAGEFFWTLINKNVQCNYLGKTDALYIDNTTAEIKSGQTKTKAGRLLFKRDSWFGSNNANNFINNLYDKITAWIDSSISAKFIEYIEQIKTISLDKFTWNDLNGFYYTCLNLLETVEAKNSFIRHIFSLTINEHEFETRFNNLDLTDDKNFKCFHFINYCLYYILVDAKLENLDKLIFISDENSLVLNKEFLLTCELDEFTNLVMDWEISYPESGFTKETNESHDRNKNRAPGIYFKG